MARGTAVGEQVVSAANTDAFREGHDRIFGGKGPKRGRWVQDPETGELVDAATYVPPSHAIDASVLAGRFYEGTKLPTGEVIQTRAQYNEHLRAKGLTHASDFGPGYADRVKAERARDEIQADRAAVREVFARAADLPQARYDREAAQRLRRLREQHDD